MVATRLFLKAPEGAPSSEVLQCARSAAREGPCASILVDSVQAGELTKSLQDLNLAVIIRDCEPRLVHHLKADGIHLSRSAPVKQLRTTFKSEAIGVFAATSRHIAMEAAEAGADYIAFAQKSQAQGEPLIGWWHDLAELPSVAFDPVAPADLATLLPQNPDFIRPLDDMWRDPESATRVIRDLAQQIT